MDHPASETSVTNTNNPEGFEMLEEKNGLYIHKDLVINNEEILSQEEIDVGTRTTIKSLEELKVYKSREHCYRRGKDKMPKLEDVVPGALYKCPVAIRPYEEGVARWMRHQQKIEGYISLPMLCVKNEREERTRWDYQTGKDVPTGDFRHNVTFTPVCCSSTRIVIRGRGEDCSYNLRFIKGSCKDER